MRETLTSICLVSITTALFKMLIPEGGFKNQINFLIACFFAASVIYLVTNGRYDFLMATETLKNDIKYVDFSQQSLNERKNAIAIEMSKRIQEILEKNAINAEKIHVIVNIRDDQSISINEIKLVFPPGTNAEQAEIAKTILESEVGSEIIITISVEQQNKTEGIP